jgi:hypothetical protein
VPDRVDEGVELDLDGQVCELDVHEALRRVAPEQEGREVSARDLGRRPPQCVRGDLLGRQAALFMEFEQLGHVSLAAAPKMADGRASG